jgi:hypothetical protein
MVSVWRLAAAPAEFVHRRRVARAALRDHAPATVVDPDAGYVCLAPGEMEGTDELIAVCEREIARMRGRLDAPLAPHTAQPKLVVDLVTDPLLAREPVLTHFALQDGILLRAMEYLDTVPYVARVSLAVSFHVPAAPEPVYFQRFHVDNDDYRHLKLYLNVRDIGPEDGPLTFLPAEASERVLRGLRRDGRPVRRTTTFTDAEVFRHCDPSELVRLTGPRGMGALLDLSRCLHYGSRVHAGRERFVYGLSLLRYHRLHENPSNSIDLRLAGSDELRRLALTGPRRHEPGRFYPEAQEGSA